jgi:uncharacterized caspase-like protein
MRYGLLLLLLCAGLAQAAEPARNAAPRRAEYPQEQRVALVIGNAAYAGAPLKNPVNDARIIAAKLQTVGFEVMLKENVTVRQIGRIFTEFRSKLHPGGVALFYYAGHGLQIKGSNYLPAVDADIASELDVPLQSIELTKLLDLLDDAKTGVNLVFLDACRNNPFVRSFRSASTGLAKVVAPSGTLISYATRPGSVAADGERGNGLYTTHLVQQIGADDIPIESVLKRVASAVKRESKGFQEPWMEGNIEGEFFFRTAETREAERREAERLATERREAERRESEKLAAEKREAERRETERLAAEKREADRKATEQLIAAKVQEAQRDIELRAAAQREADRKAAEQRELARLAQEKQEREKAAAQGKAAPAGAPPRQVASVTPMPERIAPAPTGKQISLPSKLSGPWQGEGGFSNKVEITISSISAGKVEGMSILWNHLCNEKQKFTGTYDGTALHYESSGNTCSGGDVNLVRQADDTFTGNWSFMGYHGTLSVKAVSGATEVLGTSAR